MDLATLIQKVRDLIAAARAATTWTQYVALIPAAMALIADLVALLPAQPSGPVMMASPAKKKLLATSDAKSKEDLLDDLEACCDKHDVKGKATAAAAPTGPFIDTVLPILLALLRKWLGF